MAVRNLARVLVEAVFRQRAVFLAVVVGALALAGIASAVLRPIWRATALVELPKGSNQTAGPALLAHGGLDRQVINRLGAQALYPGLTSEAALHALNSDFGVFERGGDVYQVSYDGRDPLLALKAVETALQIFSEQNARALAQAASSVYAQQEVAATANLEQVRRRLAIYRQANPQPVANDVRTPLLRQRIDLDKELKKVVAGQNEVSAQIQGLRGQMEQTPATLSPADQAGRYKLADEARARLLELQIKEQELLAKYKDSSQFVVTIRAEIAQVRSYLDEISSSINHGNKPAVNDAYVDLSRNLVKAQAQAADLESRRDTLEGQLADLDRRLDALDSSEQEGSSLQNAVADAEANLARIQEARQQSVEEATKGNTLFFIERPAVSARPLQPDPSLYFGLAILLGVPAGLGLALLCQAYSATFGTPHDVERRLGLPVLAALPVKP
jgi:uncharacterized protein involved in exopolysaccharide biosynthesis